jgi:enolase
MKIKSISAFQVYDSRGQPTIEAQVELDNAVIGRAMVPSGASVGRHEAVERRDGIKERFRGRSVFGAIDRINGDIDRMLRGRDVTDQSGIDGALIALDGTPQKSNLGANAVLAVSMAAAQAAAAARGQWLYEYLGEGRGCLLPLPEIQVFGGGKHAAGRIDLQDFMIIALGARSYQETLEMTYNVYHAAGDLMRSRGLLAGVADEGGYWPVFDRNEAVFEALVRAIELAGYLPGRDIGLSLDFAATDLYHDGRYRFGLEGTSYSTQEFIALVTRWIDDYPIVSIEDPLAEEDWPGWQQLRAEIGQRCQLIGDDLFTTNLERIQRGVAERSANAVLIKPNQIGTVTETLRAVRATQAAGWLPVVSARSGETEDAFIAHLAVATNAGQLKVGSFSRGERMAKWNEVLRIQRHLGERARFDGAQIYPNAGIVFSRR